MSALFTEVFISALLFGAITAAVPLLLAGLGEQMSEKAGVLNIGIEGMMISGAYAGFLGAYFGSSLWLGFLTGILGGMAVAVLMVLLCVRLGLNQIVIGIGLTLACEGLTALLHHFQFSRTYPRLEGADATVVPVLSGIRCLAPPCSSITCWSTCGPDGRRDELCLPADTAGPQPAGRWRQAGRLDVAGVDVVRTRTIAVLFTGPWPGWVVPTWPTSELASSCLTSRTALVSSASFWPCWRVAVRSGC